LGIFDVAQLKFSRSVACPYTFVSGVREMAYDPR